jgi:Zn-dependent protease with chaperone function
MPASRSRKLSVPNTSNKGKPAAKPNANMRKLAGCRYRRSAWRQVRVGAGVKAVISGMRQLSAPAGAWPCRYDLLTMCYFCDLQSSPSTDARPTTNDSPRWHARRAFLLAAGAGAAGSALAQVDVGSASSIRNLIPAETLENSARQQYAQTLADARAKGALAPNDHPQLQRLHAIAKRLIPHTAQWNPRARDWKWQVNLIGSKQINAWCMPGGKIAFYTAILNDLQLSDDEAAMVMGHEMAHALREHGRERLAKSKATGMGLSIASSLLGLGALGDAAANMGTQLLSLKFSRDDETEADLVGLEIAARGGYKPEASVSLWKKMLAGNSTGIPSNATGHQSNNGLQSFFSTHPSGANRIEEMTANLPKVQHLYEQARRD